MQNYITKFNNIARYINNHNMTISKIESTRIEPVPIWSHNTMDAVEKKENILLLYLVNFNYYCELIKLNVSN